MTAFSNRAFASRRHFFPHLVASVIGAALVLSTPTASRGGSIFDDDYAPPKRAEPVPQPSPVPIAPPRHDPPPVTPAPVAPPRTPAVAPTPVPVVPSVTGAAKHAIPDRASRATCRKMFEEVFDKELKDPAPASRKKFANRLLDEALKAPDGSADRFVLLCGAMQAAEEALNLRIAFTVAEQLANFYDVDETAAKVGAAAKVFGGVASPAVGSINNVGMLFRLADHLAAQDDFADLTIVEAALQHAVTKIPDAQLRLDALNQIRDMQALTDARDKTRPAFDQLKKTPDDPAANLAAGTYLCFQRAMWDQGLPLLAKSNDPTLKGLAVAELNRTADPDAVAALGDGWWDAASKLAEPERANVINHATDLYRSVQSSLSGLRKLAIDKRAADGRTNARPNRVDLLEFVDPHAEGVRGVWHMEGASLVVDQSHFARLPFPYSPPEEYDFKISFTAVKPEDTVYQICAGGGHQFMYMIGAYSNTLTAFERIKGMDGIKSQTAVRRKSWLAHGEHYTSLVKVRKTGVEAYLNGQYITGSKTDLSDMSINKEWRSSRDIICIGAHRDNLRYDAVEIIEITGEGKLLSQ